MLKQIFEKYNLNTIEVENNTYKVNNIDNKTNIESLQDDLKSCILITSNIIDKEKSKETGITTFIAHIYYIITDFNMKDLALKYLDIAEREIDIDSTIESYCERPNLASSIDTIYSAEELGKR